MPRSFLRHLKNVLTKLKNSDMGNMIDFSIREINKRDTKYLAELDKVCFAVPWSEQSFIDETENEMAYYYVATVEEIPVGYIGFWKVIDEGHITNIAVSPEYRRKGLASAMLEKVIKAAYDNNLYLLTLEVRKSNLAAQSLYAKYGFESLGERKNYYHLPTENAVIMTLILGDN